MTLSINVRPGLEAPLAAKARAEGVPVEVYVQGILEREAGGEDRGTPDDAQRQRERVEAGAAIRELRKGNRLGGLSLKDLVNEGRRI